MTKELIIDVSANQDHPIDFRKVKEAGVKGVILKATEGTDYANPYFERDLAGCNASGLPVMAYHYAGFGDVAAEVVAFTKVAGARARVLDIENTGDESWSSQFFSVLQKKFGFVKNQMMLYGSASSIPRTGAVLLWVAAYNNEGPGVPETALWQFSETGTIEGIANHVDLSHWLGSQEEFKTFFSVR